MHAFFSLTIITFFLMSSLLSSPFTLSSKEAESIGNKIWFNECSSRIDRLVWWNKGENFASMGIGHFIWYPKGQKGPFIETFPDLIEFMISNDVKVPKWLENAAHCPWKSKEDLEHSFHNERRELRTFLAKTIALQIGFMTKRLDDAIPIILENASDEEREEIEEKIKELGKSYEGKYALLDYLNFKGDGTCFKERYNGKGWGLLQVLEEMQLNTGDPITAFVKAAKFVLDRRVDRSPPSRRERQWLPGWKVRVDTYIESKP